MAYHLEAYSASIATGNTTPVVVAPVPSVIYPTVSNGFLVGSWNKIIAAAQVGTGATRFQIQSPSLRVNPFIDVSPANRGTVFESPVRYQDWRQRPLVVRTNESVQAFACQNSGGAAITRCGIWFSDGVQPQPPMTPYLTVHATGSTTLSAEVWTAVSWTLDASLDPGTYLIIGLRVFSATGIFARMVPNSGGQVHRPGVTCVQAYDGMQLPYDGRIYMGPLITFATTQFPQTEILATAGDTAQEAWFDLVQVSTSLQG